MPPGAVHTNNIRATTCKVAARAGQGGRRPSKINGVAGRLTGRVQLGQPPPPTIGPQSMTPRNGPNLI